MATAAVAGAVRPAAAVRDDTRAAHVQTIATIGIDILLVTELARRIGGDLLPLGDPWGGAVLTAGPVGIAHSRLAAIAVCAAAIGAVFAAFRFTRWGLALRAAAEEPRLPP